jgi:hypothetical protein
MLPFLFVVISLWTYVGAIRNLGSGLLFIQVVRLDTFYSVVFAPQEIGWSAAGTFGGSVIALGTLVLFRQLAVARPRGRDPAGIAGSKRTPRSFAASRGFKLLSGSPKRTATAAATADFGYLPAHMALLNRAVAEGVRTSPCNPARCYHAHGALVSKWIA